jgi:predicted nucleic acid-binding protein
LIVTNILSELQKGEKANPGVLNWYGNINGDELYLSVLVLGEIRQGIERLRRRDPEQAARLEQRAVVIQSKMTDRVLPISTAIAEHWGINNVPDALPVIDGLLAATAIEHDLTLVTRNIRDVKRSGVRLLNPFSA